MTIPLTVLSALVLAALAVTAGAPVLLLALLLRDWKRRQLW
jgi:hypothetical protein